MTEWTAELLDKLPEGTVIEFRVVLVPHRALRCKDGVWAVIWLNPGCYSKRILEVADSDSISVLSVPIEALLSGETTAIAGRALAHWTHGLAGPATFRYALGAAIAHVTGED